ncbi:MAG: DNA-binding protein [Nanoarchaeota archaeon]
MDELQTQAEGEQQLQQLEAIVKASMTKDAVARFSNIKVAHPQKAAQVLLVLGQLLQQGAVQRIDDDLLKAALMRLTPKRRETTIKRI